MLTGLVGPCVLRIAISNVIVHACSVIAFISVNFCLCQASCMHHLTSSLCHPFWGGRFAARQAGRTQFRQQPPWQGFASIQLAEMTVRLADFSLGDMAKKYRIAHFARAQKSRKPLANGNGPNNRFVLHHAVSLEGIHKLMSQPIFRNNVNSWK